MVAGTNPGTRSINLLRMTNDVVAGQAVVIGADTWEAVNGPGAGVIPGSIPIDISGGATAAAWGTALAASINADDGTEAISAFLQSGQHVLIVSDEPGVNALACSETLAGANNVWMNATMVGGSAAGVVQLAVVKRVPTATEVTFGQMFFAFGFVPRIFQIFVAPTATPDANAAFDGVLTDSGDDYWILDKAGSVDWAVTDTVTIIAIG